MRRYLLAAVAAAAISTPAMARDGQGYVGLEAGVVFPRDSDANVDVLYSTLNVPGGVPNTPIFVDQSFDDAISLDAKTGYEIGIFGGYDFGMFRVEGEIDWKHANLDDITVDSDLLAALNAIDDTAPFVDSDFNLDEAVGTLSFMLNGLLDFGDQDGLSFQGGFGAGWAKTKLINEKDGSFAWQLILGTQYALSPNLDIGLRYKYFSTGSLDLSDSSGFSLTGSRVVAVDPDGTGPLVPVNVTQTTTADVFTDFESKVRMHSLVATLTYNFGEAEPPPPPPPPATQTCPDGSVILATEACPVPPPPPPPPPPAPERGL